VALTKYKEHSHEVSKETDKCPNCGAPIKKKTSFFTWLVLLKEKASFFTWLVLLFSTFMFISYLGNNNSSSHRSSSFSAASSTPNVHRDIRYAHSTINIREGAGKNYRVTGQLKSGDSVEVNSISNKWAEVATGGTVKGYVYEPLLKHNPLPSLEIVDWNWYTDSDFGADGAVIWNVGVRNNTNRYVEKIRVKFSTYDANDKLITAHSVYVRGLSPGGTVTAQSYATYFGREKAGRIRIVP